MTGKLVAALLLLGVVAGAGTATIALTYIDDKIISEYRDGFYECIDIAKECKTRLVQTENMIDSCIEQYGQAQVQLDQTERAYKQCIKVEFEFAPKKGKNK